ncbi:MAG: hypothetical protein J3K34DRAFT_463028 [Monoraphidium minutum]|nr:MAG: hypothetical protein J3K34DRAFT_463028 [Monoraphidium minutum]
MLSTLQMRTLQSIADVALDEAVGGLLDWKLLEPNCRMRGLPKLMQMCKVHRVAPTLVQAAAYKQALSSLHLLVGFVCGHRHAQHVLEDHIRHDTCDEPETFVKGAPDPDRAPTPGGGRGGAEARRVLSESEAAVAAALALVAELTRSHPSLPAWMRSKQAALEVLTEQQHFLSQLCDAGMVQPREALLLDELLHTRFKDLLQSNTGVTAALQYSRSRPPINVLPLFDSLDDSEAAALMRHAGAPAFGHVHGAEDLRWRVYLPGQAIAALGSKIDCVVVIAKGSVLMHFPAAFGAEEHVVVASVGDPLCVGELMLGVPRTSELIADSMVQALLVPAGRFLQLVGSLPPVRRRAWQATAAQLAAQHHDILGVHKQLAPLNMFFRACEVEQLKEGAAFDVPRTGLLLTGEVEPCAGAAAAADGPAVAGAARPLPAPAELPPGGYVVLRDAMVLQVPRGPEVPSHLETTTYQAQVLGKGAIPVASPMHSSSAGDDLGGPRAPVKSSLLGRISRAASDGLPDMPFLQRALAAMRAERAAGGGGGAARLRTVSEAAPPQDVEAGAASAAAASAAAASAAAASTGAAAAAARHSGQLGPGAVARRAIDSLHERRGGASLRRDSGNVQLRPSAMARTSALQ